MDGKICDPKAYIQFICLNPSTADEHQDDPTVRRCWQRTRRLGYGAFVMTNLFAFRATDPRDMRRTSDPVGPWNDDYLETIGESAGLVVLAWGVHGEHSKRSRHVLRLMEPFMDKLRFIEATAGKAHPKHPLYLKSETPLQPAEPFFKKFLQGR